MKTWCPRPLDDGDPKDAWVKISSCVRIANSRGKKGGFRGGPLCGRYIPARMNSTVAAILDWYARQARALPWREDPPDPYHVWLSEVMLQQTRVEAVREAYARILSACPRVEDLAALPEESLLKLWEGLGYYSRARNLHRAAKRIAEAGAFPASWEGWRALPGVGDYTAGAIASIVLGEARPAVDGNVLRVLSRLFARGTSRPDATALFASWMEPGNCGAFTQAWMELGEVVCIPNGRPHCAECPLAPGCQAHLLGREQDFPAPAKRPARPVEKWTVFRVQDASGRMALRRRGENGLLAGMWEFLTAPGCLGVTRAKAFLADLGVSAGVFLRRLPDSRHLFTHRQWEMRNYLVRLSEDSATLASLPPGIQWATPRELRERYAVPSAFRGVLAGEVPPRTRGAKP